MNIIFPLPRFISCLHFAMFVFLSLSCALTSPTRIYLLNYLTIVCKHDTSPLNISA